jgi:lysophospholipase L1-like esterase
LKNIVLMLASVVLTFGVAEVALRLSHRIPTNSLRSPDLRTLEAQPGLFQPDQDFIDRLNPALPYRVRTNSAGFRGPEFAIEKPAGCLRILCVGDSYTFGPYVQEDQSLPGVLGRLLARRTPPAVEVINGGASGFTILDERRFLEERALAIAPDIVLLFFCQNDIRDLGQKRATIDLMRDHAATKSMPLLGPMIGLLQQTALFNAMQKVSAQMWVRRRAAQQPVLSRNETGHWEIYRTNLRAMADLLARRRIRWMVVAWPSAQQLGGSESLEPQERLEGLAREAGVPFLDLTPALQDLRRKGERAYLVPLDGHPSAAGYEASARAVAERLLQLGYLPPSDLLPGVQD